MAGQHDNGGTKASRYPHLFGGDITLVLRANYHADCCIFDAMLGIRSLAQDPDYILAYSRHGGKIAAPFSNESILPAAYPLCCLSSLAN